MNLANLVDNAETFVEFLGNVLGDNCEVVLQDVKEGRIKAIANGHVSGRSVGAPLTDYALKIVQSEIWKERNYDCNYMGRTCDNHELRSSTYFIKDQNNNDLLAMLCINVSNKPYEDVIEIVSKLGMLGLKSAESGISDTPGAAGLSANGNGSSNDANKNYQYGENLIENFSLNVSHIVSSLLPEALDLPGDIPLSRLTQDERIKIMERLASQGVFKIKGSISELAKLFECSEATIYRYLSKIE